MLVSANVFVIKWQTVNYFEKVFSFHLSEDCFVNKAQIDPGLVEFLK